MKSIQDTTLQVSQKGSWLSVFSQLRTRLFLLILLILLPALLLALYTASEQNRLAANTAQQESLRLAQLAASNQEQLVEGARQLLVALAQLPIMQNGTSDECNALFVKLHQQYTNYTNLFAVNVDGTTFCTGLPNASPVNVTNQSWFQRAMQTTGFSISDYNIGIVSKRPIITFSYPALDEAGKIKRQVGASLDLGWVNSFISSGQLSPDTSLTAIDRNGAILFQYPNPDGWLGKPFPNPALATLLAGQNSGTFEGQGLDGEVRLFGFSALGKTNGSAYVLVGISNAVAYAQVNQLLFQNLVSLGLIGLLTLAIAWFGVNRLMVRPTRSLLISTAQLASGDLSARIDTRLTQGTSELYKLSQAFNGMADALEHRQKELADSNTELAREIAERKRVEAALLGARSELEQRVTERTAELARAYIEMQQARQIATDTLESIADGFFSVDRQWRLTYINRRAEQLVKRPTEQMLGKVLWEVFPMTEDSVFATETNRAAAEGETTEVQLFSPTLDIWMLFRLYPSPEGISFFVQDITERRRTEQRTRLLTEASTVLASSLDYQVTFGSIAHLIVSNMADWCAIHIMDDTYVPQIAVSHKWLADVEWAANMQQFYGVQADAMHTHSILATVMRTGQSAFLIDVADDASENSVITDDLQTLRSLSVSSVMIVPLMVRANTVGIIKFVLANPKQHYTADDLIFAEELARRVAISIDNSRLYQEAQAQREQLQVTLSSIGDAVIATDRQGFVTFVNPIAQMLTGWTQEAAAGNPLPHVFRIIDEATRQPIENPAAKVIREGTIIGLANHTLLIAKDGREIPIDDSGAPILSESGEISGVILVFRDITERKQKTEDEHFLAHITALLSSSLDYETTLERIAQLVVPRLADYCSIHMVQDDGSIRQMALTYRYPAGAERLRSVSQRYPYSADAPHGSALVIRTGQPELIPDLAEFVENIPPELDVVQIMRSAGLISSMTLPLIARERILGALTCLMGESGRHYTPDDLALAEELARRAALAIDNARLYRQAQEAIQARDEFLSVAAHELKTPVTSLRGFSQTLLRQLDKNGLLDPVQSQRALSIIDQQSVKLASLVSQLLDLSRLEAGRLTLDRQMMDVVPLIREVVATLQRNTTIHTLSLDTPPILEAFVDPLRLEQVLVNLLDNAIKYSPDGGQIVVELSTSDAHTMRFSVTDQGLGIPPERRERIFERFYQAHQEGYRGGMGLGLYVSNQIVDLHGGQIEAEFPPEGGTRFIVYLPLDLTVADDGG